MQEHFRQAMAQLENEHWWYRARRTILEQAVDRFVGDTARALTVGVGAMREAEMLAKRTRLVAIDRAPINPDCTMCGGVSPPARVGTTIPQPLGNDLCSAKSPSSVDWAF